MEPMILNIILYQEGPYWVGKCLELDILTSGRDKDLVTEDAAKICEMQVSYAIANDQFDHLFRPPDGRLHDRFWKSVREHGVIHLEPRDVNDTPIHMRMAEVAMA